MKKAVLTFASFLILIGAVAQTKDLKMPRYKVTAGWVKTSQYIQEFEGKKKEFHLVEELPQPRMQTWEEAKQKFDFSKTVPKPEPSELMATKHLPAVFEKIYQKTFQDASYGLKTPPDPNEDWLRSFGNVMAHFKALRGKAPETQESLSLLAAKYPQIWQELKEVLPSLVQTDFLYSEKWTPYKDESAPGKNDDGIFFLPFWKMQSNPKRGADWNTNLGEHKVYQGGVFMYSALADIKRVERNYREYTEHVGMGYLMVAPVIDSYTLGMDHKGDEFVGLEVFMSQDLPWPYDATRYIMNNLDYYNDKGQYISDYYSLNRHDLNWMAGRDTFFEVKTTAGQFIGFLIATELDYDIKNLPERDKDRVISIKGAWGNIKVLSEGFGRISKVPSAPGKLEK